MGDATSKKVIINLNRLLHNRFFTLQLIPSFTIRNASTVTHTQIMNTVDKISTLCVGKHEPDEADQIPLKEDELPTLQRCENGASLDEPISSIMDDLTSEHALAKHQKVDMNEQQRRCKVGELFPKSDGTKKLQILTDDTNNSASRDEEPFSLSDPKFKFVLPSKIANMLYPHQREGLEWLWSLHCKGKDMQLFGGAIPLKLDKEGISYCSLDIITPLDERNRFSGTYAEARRYELQYILQDKGVLLTTYDICRNNFKSLYGDHGKMEEDAITWDYMILDEGHLIKNPSTQRAESLLEIPCDHCIIISGTPLQNNLKELWALLNFCCPGLLCDKESFKYTYELPIRRGNYKKASDKDKLRGSVVAQDLRTCITPYLLRRLKNEVFCEDGSKNTAKLSKKNEIVVWLKLSHCQRELYTAAVLNSKIVHSPFSALTAIYYDDDEGIPVFCTDERLRTSPCSIMPANLVLCVPDFLLTCCSWGGMIFKNICDHPLLLTKRAAEDLLYIADAAERFAIGKNNEILSCKISFIVSLLDNLIPEGHNVLIFSQTRIMLNLIQDTLDARGYKFLRIDGTTKASDRLKNVNDFQEGDGAPIFLLTTRVGGLGLNLTKADRVILVNPAWNPSTDNQCVDRAYRIGQKKDVIVYRLMTCGTLEEKMYRQQIYKAGLFKSATEDKEQIRYFSYWDLKEPISLLPKQGFDVSLTQQQLHKEHDSEHKMDSSLKALIKFLESLGIADISHHSLLFSKTSPVPIMQDYELRRIRQSMHPGNSFSHTTCEQNMDARPRFTFNPKDYVMNRKNLFGRISINRPESEIEDRTKLSDIFANKLKKANPGPFEMRNQSWAQRRTSTIFGVEEESNESRTRPVVLQAHSVMRASLNLLQNESKTQPPALKASSKATVETSTVSTSRAIIQRVRQWLRSY